MLRFLYTKTLTIYSFNKLSETFLQRDDRSDGASTKLKKIIP